MDFILLANLFYNKTLGVNIKDGMERRDWVSVCMQGEGEPEAQGEWEGRGRRASVSCGKGHTVGRLQGGQL